MFHGGLVFAQVLDVAVDLLEQEFLVFHEEFRPHVRREPSNARHILVAAGGKALVLFRRGALDVGVGRHMRQLRGEGDHLVVLLGGCDGVAPKARGREQVFHMAE